MDPWVTRTWGSREIWFFSPHSTLNSLHQSVTHSHPTFSIYRNNNKNHIRNKNFLQSRMLTKISTKWLLWGDIGPSTTIFPTVSSEACPVGKCFWAVGALVGWNIVVSVHVVSEIFFDGKPFPTDKTPVQCLLQVNSQHMTFATTLCRKGSAA